MLDAQAFRPLRTRTPRVTKLEDIPAISTWPSPPTENFASETHELFLKNRLAVELYAGHSTADEIKQRTGYAISKARKLTEKCMRINPNTQGMVGLWACIPGRRLPGETHHRKAPLDPNLSAKGQGLKGALKYLFNKRPLIERDMVHLIRHRCLPGQAQLSILGYKTVVDTFHAVCRSHGVRPDEWPFSTNRQGENAIYLWWKKVRANFPLESILHQYGEEAHKLALVDLSGIVSQRAPQVFAAYERVELDEHLIHQ